MLRVGEWFGGKSDYIFDTVLYLAEDYLRDATFEGATAEQAAEGLRNMFHYLHVLALDASAEPTESLVKEIKRG